MNRTPEQIAEILAEIYTLSFGGKQRSRFKITRSNLRRISGRKRLEDSTVARVVAAAFETGFIMIDLGDQFAVVEERVMLNYRPVPKSVVSAYIEDKSAAPTDNDDDDD